MNRIDRLTGIILALQNRRQTAAQLAERFEVSRRTILRDVDALSQIGVPIVALPGTGGGLSLGEDYWLKPVQLTSAEASALLLAARSLTAHPDGPFAGPGQSAIDKLRAALRPEVLSIADKDLGRLRIAPPRHASRLGHFRVVYDAIAEGRWLQIEYQSLRRIASHVVLPLGLDEDEGLWYCSAIALDAGEERRFRLDRMRTVRPIAAPNNADEAVRRSSVLGRAYDDPAHPEVIVALTYQGARMAEDLPHHGEAVRQIRETSWELRLRCPPSELRYWARTFFGFGPHARVVAPAELQDMIVELIRATAEIYAGKTSDGDGQVSPFEM